MLIPSSCRRFALGKWRCAMFGRCDSGATLRTFVDRDSTFAALLASPRRSGRITVQWEEVGSTERIGPGIDSDVSFLCDVEKRHAQLRMVWPPEVLATRWCVVSRGRYPSAARLVKQLPWRLHLACFWHWSLLPRHPPEVSKGTPCSREDFLRFLEQIS